MSKVGNKIRDLLSGDFILKEVVLKNWRILLYVTMLLIMYIYNGFAAQTEVRRIQKIQKEILETRYRLLDISSEYTQLTRPSNLNQTLKEQESKVHESKVPPIVIK